MVRPIGRNSIHIVRCERLFTSHELLVTFEVSRFIINGRESPDRLCDSCRSTLLRVSQVQPKYPTQRRRRIINRERDLLDQKWLTYLLTFILVLLGVVFVLAVIRRDWLIHQAKWIVKSVALGFGLE